MTARDRTVLLVVVAVAAIGAYWFLLLAPRQKQAGDLTKQVAAQQQSLAKITSQLSSALAARRDYARNYTTVARLGQAVPAEDEIPSLVFQLDSAAQASHVDFRAVKLTGSATPTPAPAAAPPAAPAPAGGSSSSTSSTSASTTTSTSSTTSAAPTAAATAALPPGASVGPAGFPTMPFALTFDGSFFNMAGFFHRLHRFVDAGGTTVRVGGRLLTLDAISLSAGRKGFPDVKATISATAYLVPPTQGATGGATPGSPSTTTTQSTTSTSSPSGATPPAATATPPVR